MATGIVSSITVCALYKIVLLVLILRTVAQLETEIEQRKKAEKEAEKLYLENERSKELLKLKDEFITMPSHELRTPLTSLKGYLHIAMKTDFEDCSPSYLDIINKAGEQARICSGFWN